MNLSTAIKNELKNKKTSQAEFARKLKCSRATVNSNLKHWENGHSPSIRTLKKWCKALEVDYKFFINFL